MMKSSSRSMLRAQINSTLDRCCVGNHESGMCSLLPSERPGVLAVGSEMLDGICRALYFSGHTWRCAVPVAQSRAVPGRVLGDTWV